MDVALIDGANWAALWTAIAQSAIALGIVFAAGTWKAQRRRRDGETVNEMSRRWDNPEMRAVRAGLRRQTDPLKLANKAVSAYREDNDNWYEKYEPLLNFFEDLGALEKCKAVRLGIIADSLQGTVVRSWKQWGPAVQMLRVHAGDNDLYSNFELLACRLQGERLRPSQRVRRRLHLKF